MSAHTRTISINSGVFKWLFNTSGCTKKEISEKTGINSEKWNLYLESEEPIPLALSTINTLADLYHRPITAFLIPEAPKDSEIPKDFRRNGKNGEYSKKLHRTFNKARRSLKLYLEMMENIEEEIPETPSCSINDNPEEIAERERKRLGIANLNISRKKDDAYKQWRAHLTENGIPVLQYNMDADGVRGFIIRYGGASAIAVNSGDAPNGKIFTIFHEYAHILLGTNSVCTDDGEVSADADINKIEHWCDHFAGAFLMPETAVRENSKVLDLVNSGYYAKAAEKLSVNCTVSKAAALVRLRVLGIIPENACETELREWRYAGRPKKPAADTEDEEEENTKKGGPDGAVLRVAELGASYVNLASKNYENGHITYAGYLNTIGISKNSYERLRKKGVIE
ncbi:MAG: ImmA/IrrE family metallo-endopeptidase [Methanocorpusculaceae archaeon]|nr:ImmA/IrrE family metallo-endopeptidase [Methanocorpusculaceae archaeon]